MKKPLVIALTLITSLGVIVYATWTYLTCINKHPSYVANSNELIFTTAEAKASEKWKDKSLDDLVDDAHSGNPAGLWVLGMSFLIGGMEFPIDTSTANKYFAWSGSLGFAPSLDQMRRMYMFDAESPFLAMVYLNLTISAGHPELAQLYHKMRTHLIEQMGIAIADEIEKIAIHKKSLIEKNIKSTQERPQEAFKLMLSGSIADEDVLFDMGFWDGIATGRLVTGNLEEWLCRSDNYCRKIGLLAQQTNNSKERLASYPGATNAI